MVGGDASLEGERDGADGCEGRERVDAVRRGAVCAGRRRGRGGGGRAG